MNYVSLFLIIASAFLINESASQLPLPLPIPAPVPVPVPVPLPLPLGLGLGLPFGLGFPFFGLGLGRFGLGLGGFGRFGLGLGGFGRFGRFGGRFGRSSEEAPVMGGEGNRTCQWDAQRSVIRCDGEREPIECQAEARLDEIRNITVILPGLTMIPEPLRITGQREVPVVRLYSRVVGDATLIIPRSERRVILSIYSSSAISEPGWFIKDAKCWERFNSFVSTRGVSGSRFSLNWIRQ